MNIGHYINSMLGNLRTGDMKALELRPGQTVRATVLQTSDDGEAVLSIQGVAVRAKLDPPSSVGQTLMMRVLSSEDGELRLNPLPSSPGSPATVTAGEWLRSLGLPDERHLRQLVEMMRQAGILLNKENVEQAVRAMAWRPERVPMNEWIGATVTALSKRLPLTLETIGALRQALYGPPFGQELNRFAADIAAFRQGFHQVAHSPQHSASFTGLLAAISRAIAEVAAFSSRLSGADENAFAQGSASQSRTALSTSSSAPFASSPSATPSPGATSISAGTTAQATASMTGFPINTTSSNATPFASASAHVGQLSLTKDPSGNSRLAAGVAPDLTSVRSNTANGTNSAIRTASGQAHTSTSAAVSGNGAENAQAQRTAMNASGDGMRADVSSKNTAGANEARGGQPAAMAAGSAANGSGSTSAARSEDAPVLMRLLQSLGVDYERTILLRPPQPWTAGREGMPLTPSALADGGTVSSATVSAADSLKGLLLQLLAAEETPPALREGAQLLVQQLTGHQLMMAADRSSLMNHMTWVIPILNDGGKETATVTIQSRRHANGTIDADNCRLLFDLHMHTIGNTIVDVKVTDKNVYLKMLNDFPHLLEVLKLGESDLQSALKALGYRLISVRTEQYPLPSGQTEGDLSGKAENGQSESVFPLSARVSERYKGVDVRI